MSNQKPHKQGKSRMKYLVLKEKLNQSRVLYPMKLSFRSEGKVKTFSEKEKLKELISSIVVFQ